MRGFGSTSARRVLGRTGAGHIRAGFTLLETMMALVIIGVGVLAFVEAQKSFIQANSWSSQAATGQLLANEIRERMRRLPRHDPVLGLFLQAGANNSSSTLVGWGRETQGQTVADLNDVDDFDGLTFGVAGQYPGPINAFGEVIPQTNPDGTPLRDAAGNAVGMRGWTQTVRVDKVEPYNFATVRDRAYVQAATSSVPGRAVDQFPLRVTVIVSFQGPLDVQPQEVTRLVWIQP